MYVCMYVCMYGGQTLKSNTDFFGMRLVRTEQKFEICSSWRQISYLETRANPRDTLVWLSVMFVAAVRVCAVPCFVFVFIPGVGLFWKIVNCVTLSSPIISIVEFLGIAVAGPSFDYS